jgi:hypothetical protein
MNRSICRASLAVGLIIVIGACGSSQDLRIAKGEQMPVKPAMAAKAPTADELLDPPPIARPERVNELITHSEERKDDRFDLPPPG